MISTAEARRQEIEEYVAKAKRQIANTDRLYGGHQFLIHQNGNANIDIMLAQHHEASITRLLAELAEIDEDYA